MLSTPYRKLIVSTFPEINFGSEWAKGWISSLSFIHSVLTNKCVFEENRNKGYWKDRENRRQFLIDLATSKGLDPFKSTTWTSTTWKDVIAAKVRNEKRITNTK
jgi:hypothetical protein